MTQLYMIRHGQASFGTDNYDRLSELGDLQARLLGNYFKRIGLSFDRVYSGTLERQKDTARIVVSSMTNNGTQPGFHKMDAFDEFNSTAFLANPIQDLLKDNPNLSEDVIRAEQSWSAFRRVVDRAMMHAFNARQPMSDAESPGEFILRVKAGIEQVVQENQSSGRVAIFTSGGTMSAAMHIALNLDIEETIRLGWQIKNTSVTTFAMENDRLTLISFNSVPHLECRNDPKLITMV